MGPTRSTRGAPDDPGGEQALGPDGGYLTVQRGRANVVQTGDSVTAGSSRDKQQPELGNPRVEIWGPDVWG